MFSKNQITKIEKKILVDPDPIKVGTLGGSEGPKVIFLIFWFFE